jgi:uncharacterized protein YkwD
MKISEKIKIKKMSHIFLLLFIVTLTFAMFLSFKLAKVSNQLLIAQANIKAQSKNMANVDILGASNSADIRKNDSKISPTTSPWGISKQIDEKTWTMQLRNDEKMATPDEIFRALNEYRRQHGAEALILDASLTDFAKKRAATFVSIGGLDGHAGFNEYFKKNENMKNMGVTGVGENSSYGYKLAGVHLIEWVFAGDAPHNNNQLEKTWNHVGIAVAGSAVDVVFGRK